MAKSGLSRIIFSFFLLFLLVGGAQAAEVVSQGLRAVVQNAAPAEKIPVILSFSTPAQTRATVRTQSVHGREELVRTLMYDGRERRAQLMDYLHEKGVDRVRELWLIDSLAFEATPELIEELADWPGVANVQVDEKMPLLLEPVEPFGVQPQLFTNPESNLAEINVPALWDLGIAGDGIVVAVVDSGVDVLHPDLAPNWRGGSNSWFDPFDGTTIPSDFLDNQNVAHGTAVAGIAAGRDAGGSSVGTAPKVEWIAAKIFDSSDFSTTNSTIHAALQWLLDPDGDPRTPDAPDILNGSWGFSGQVNECNAEFQPDVQALRAAGISVVFSAGNQADPLGEEGASVLNSSLSPANYPESYAVGSVFKDAGGNLVVSDFSGRGPSACEGDFVYPDVVAPGELIRSPDLTDLGSVLTQFQEVTGTSFSAPHVAGALALLKEAFPGRAFPELESALSGSAVDLGDAGVDNAAGNGLIDVLGAFRALAGDTPRIRVIDSLFPGDGGAIDFGSVAVNSSRTATVRVQNAGGGTLNISTVDVAGLAEPFSMQADTCTGAALQGGESCSFEVAFAPTTADFFSGTIEVLGDGVTANLPVTGTGGPPQSGIFVGEPNVTFGAVPVGSRLLRTVTVTSTRSADLGNIFPGTSDLPAGVTVARDECAGVSLAAGETCNIHLLFAPQTTAVATGSLTISSNAPESVSLRVNAGNAAPPPATLIRPEHRLDIPGTSVTFEWRQFADPDGDAIVSSELILDSTATFSNPLTANGTQALPTLALPGLALSLWLWRRRRGLASLALIGTLALLISCGGGGGDGEILPPPAEPPPPLPPVTSMTVDNLEPGVTYYWKIRTEDARGAIVETPTRQFTLR